MSETKHFAKGDRVRARPGTAPIALWHEVGTVVKAKIWRGEWQVIVDFDSVSGMNFAGHELDRLESPKSAAHVRGMGRAWKAACKELNRRCAHNAKYARQISGVTQRLELAAIKNGRLTTENADLRARLKSFEARKAKS